MKLLNSLKHNYDLTFNYITKCNGLNQLITHILHAKEELYNRLKEK